MNKAELAKKIQALDGLSNDEKSALLELMHKQKKYGLVFEEKSEDIEECLRNQLPVLREASDCAIISDNPKSPNHIIIEGDNLVSLSALAYTHRGKIDLIYIDPPYNTGNKDFVYNDSFVDTEDSYRHSKWLSFMAKRLKIAKVLLSERGGIFISIDDNEYANLRLLCNEIFGEYNFVASPVRRRRKSQANLSKNISTIHEYVLIYRCSPNFELNKIEAQIDISEYKNPDNDPRGPYKTMPCTNKGGSKYSVTTPTGKVIQDEWRFKEETYYALLNDNRLVFPRGGAGKPRYKLFLSDKKNNGIIANSWWAELESNQEGASLLKEIMSADVFNNPKPNGLIKFILALGSQKDSIILDFFAGSGTTLHAIMQQNAEDGGKRQCILCTNNENGICENVTYERNKRVINGYTKPNGEVVAGLTDNNLRYYRTDLLSREQTIKNMRELVHASTDLLCIRNDIYNEAPFGGKLLNPKVGRYFANEKEQMLIIYDERAIPFIVPVIAKMGNKPQIKVYVFSYGSETYENEFDNVTDNVTLCALPKAIYDAYHKLLHKRKPTFLIDNVVQEIEKIDTNETLGVLFDSTTEEGGAE